MTFVFMKYIDLKTNNQIWTNQQRLGEKICSLKEILMHEILSECGK